MSAKRLSITTFATVIVLLTMFSLMSRAEPKNQTVQNKIAKALAKRLEVNYIETPLNNVAVDLQATLGVSVLLDKRALADVGISTDTPVTFKSSKTSARAAIGFMLEQLGLTIITQNDIVLITTPEYQETALITKIYKVDDLICRDGVPIGRGRADFDSLIDMITSCVRPSTWFEGTGPQPIGCIDINGLTAIAFVQTEEVHREIERTLSDLRAVRHKPTKDTDGRRTLPEPIATPIPPDVEAIQRALDKPVTLKFDATPLDAVAWQLEKKLGISVRIYHRALADFGIKENEPVTFSVSDVSARTAIALMLRKYGLTTMIAHESLIITTPEEANTRLTTRVYDVADLLPRDPKHGNQYDFESLLEMIRWCTAPTTWGEVGGTGTIAPYEADGIAAFVVSQTSSIHSKIEKHLAQLRTFRHTSESKPNERITPFATLISEAEKAIREALDKPVTLKYDKTPLEAVVKDLKEKLNIPILIDRRGLEDLGIEIDTPITFAASDVSARTAIALMLYKLHLSTIDLDGSLVITTPEEGNFGLTTRIYDIADLFPRERKNNKKELDAFRDAIASGIVPYSWDDVGGPGIITPCESNGITVFVVSQTSSIHSKIEKLLARLRSVRHTSELKPKERIAPIHLPLSKAEKTLREALAKPISLQFKDASLATVVDLLKEKTGLQIILDEKRKTNPKTLTFSVQDIPLESALNLISHFCSVYWTCYDGFLVIAGTDDKLYWLFTRCYDVSDLPYYRDERGNGLVNSNELIYFLTCSVAESSWEGVGGPGTIASCEAEGIQSLVVYQTWQNHRAIERTLAEVRRLRGPAPTKEEIEKLPPPPKPPQPDPKKTPPKEMGKGMF